MIEAFLNKQQAEALFAQECILLGSENVVPIARTVELFGRSCAEWIESGIGLGCYLRGGYHYNMWSAGGANVHYLTYSGFQQAVSWHNCRLFSQRPTEGSTAWAEIWAARVGKLDAKDAEYKKRSRKKKPAAEGGTDGTSTAS